MSKSGSLAIASPPSATEALTPPCLCIDIETPPSMSNNRFGPAVIHKLAAFRPDSGDKLVVQGAAPALTTEVLDALTEGAGFVLGHNIWRHDLPLQGQVFPNLKLLALPVVDTLELSPLAFPDNPYHRLVKDYKLASDARSQPLRDAELSLSLFHTSWTHQGTATDPSRCRAVPLSAGDELSPDKQSQNRSFLDGVVFAPPRRRVVSSKLDEVTRAREYMIFGTERHLAGAIRR